MCYPRYFSSPRFSWVWPPAWELRLAACASDEAVIPRQGFRPSAGYRSPADGPLRQEDRPQRYVLEDSSSTHKPIPKRNQPSLQYRSIRKPNDTCELPGHARAGFPLRADAGVSTGLVSFPSPIRMTRAPVQEAFCRETEGDPPIRIRLFIAEKTFTPKTQFED